MQDVVVLEQLRKRGWIDKPYHELLPYESMERYARILDKPPKQISLSKVGEVNPCGTAQKFSMIYEQLKSSGSLEMGKLDLRGTIRYCDVSVFYTLQTLIRLSTGKSKDLITAAADIFKLLITHPCEVLTEQTMYSLLNGYSPINFYAGELVNGIQIAVFKESAAPLYWKALCEFTGFYVKAVELGMEVIRNNCTTEKDVRNFCNTHYKEAKADSEFMSKVYKPGANKWLVAMLYYLSKDNPELLSCDAPEGILNYTEVEADE